MTAEWKPGDLISVPCSRGRVRGFIRADGGAWTEGGDSWSARSVGDYGDVRRLVVIDPEDREQVARLAKAWHVQPGVLPWDECDERDKADSVDSLAVALREFANPTPPKPEEPTGLGAVVRDRIGQMWTRTDDAHYPWFYAAARFTYADIDAVEVLSEGVTP